MKKDLGKPIGELPSGVDVNKVLFKGQPYWRVRLGKRFTGGEVRFKHFTDLAAARKFFFGEDGNDEKRSISKLRLIQLGIVGVKDQLGAQAFELTANQLGEAQNAFRRLPPNNSLTQIIDDWLIRIIGRGKSNLAPAMPSKSLMEAISAELLGANGKEVAVPLCQM